MLSSSYSGTHRAANNGYDRNVMTDVQVSNARRISFTALAVVSFWVLTWREYSIACDDVFDRIGLGSNLGVVYSPDPHSVYLAASMAVVPTVFLTISVSNCLRRLLDPWIAVATALIVATVLAARWLGLKLNDALDAASWEDTEFLAEFEDQQEVPWLWLLLPLILTTAFVIFGAWRSAVKAREVEAEAVGEDE